MSKELSKDTDLSAYFELDLLRVGPAHQVFDENLERHTRLLNFGLTENRLVQLLS